MKTLLLSRQNEAENSASFFDELLSKYPQLLGAFYRSTMELKYKVLIIKEFLTSGNITELPALVELFKSAYDLNKISKRNQEWQDWFDP